MRGNIWLKILFPLVVILLLVIIFWNWDWFIPLVDAQASAELGRKVTMQHLHVGFGRDVTVTATGVTIANPDGFPANEPPLATIDRLRVQVDALDYIRRRTLSLTTIELDHPAINLRQLPDGTNNYTLKFTPSGKPPRLGNLIINQGTASVIMPLQKSNFDLTLQTQPHRQARGCSPAGRSWWRPTAPMRMRRLRASSSAGRCSPCVTLRPPTRSTCTCRTGPRWRA